LLCLVVLYVVSGLSRTVFAQKYTFDQVVSGLKYRDAATRLRAIQLLKEADYPEAAVPLAEVFGDPEDRVQLAAIDAERSLFTSRPVTRKRKVGFVIEVRATTQTAESQLALKVRTVPPQVLAGLTTALRDRNPNVRVAAIDLAALLAPQACWRQTNPDACSQLGNALIENINTRQPQLRRLAMQALGRLRYAGAVQALSDQLSYYQKGPDALAALEGLAGIGHSTSVSIFQQSLASSNADIRRLAVEGIARAADRGVLAEVHQTLQGDRSPAVLLALHYANARLRHGIGEVDLKLADASVTQLVASLRDPALAPFAIRYLLDLGETVAPALAESLRGDDPETRQLVADILGFSGDQRVLPALEAATKDPDPHVVIAAQGAISRINLR
jgi:HEAT repeat protein